MAKVKGKGTIVQHTISAALVAIAQCRSVEFSGTKSETYDSTTLDQATAFKTFDQTGYSEPGELKVELFYDPALAGHQFITDLIATPADNAMRVTYADGASTTQSFTQSGVEFGATIAMDEGVVGEVTYTIDGDPGWPT